MMTRQEFLIHLGRSGWGLVLAGCGGGSSYDAGPAPPPPGPSCGATLITGNHGHALVVPAADLSSTVAMSYNILGTADHSHIVTLSAAQLAELKAGRAVTVSSSATLAHLHEVTVACG